MSWIEKINTDFVITLTASKSDVTLNPNARGTTKVEFKPNWVSARRVYEYNVAEFNFNGQRGTLVVRGTNIGCKYNMQIFFQGENYLDEVQSFIDASKNSAPWEISHPMYGGLLVQPFGLDLDDTGFNVTKITAMVMETLPVVNIAKVAISPVDTIPAQALNVDIVASQAYATNIPTALVSDVQSMEANTDEVFDLEKAFADTTDALQAVQNAYNEANASIDNAFSDAFSAVRSIQRLINLPATFQMTVARRVNFLIGMANQLSADVASLTTPRKKRLYENNVTTVFTTMCATTVINPAPSDYRSRTSIINIIESILTSYNAFLLALNELQTDTADTPDSYVPDFDTLNQLDTLVKFTLSNLLNISVDAKQERTYRLDRNSNVILLAYQLYGLLPDDSTITQLITDNNIGLNQLLNIKKGTDIVYFV